MPITPVQFPVQQRSKTDKLLGITQAVAPIFGPMGIAVSGGIGVYNLVKPDQQQISQIQTSDTFYRRMKNMEQNPITQIEEAKSALDYLDLSPEQREKLEKPLNLALTQKGNV